MFLCTRRVSSFLKFLPHPFRIRSTRYFMFRNFVNWIVFMQPYYTSRCINILYSSTERDIGVVTLLRVNINLEIAVKFHSVYELFRDFKAFCYSLVLQVSFFSTSPELSNKQRFEYFSRTIPSDHYQVKAMVEIVMRMGWSYVSIIYEESNYGIKVRGMWGFTFSWRWWWYRRCSGFLSFR